MCRIVFYLKNWRKFLLFSNILGDSQPSLVSPKQRLLVSRTSSLPSSLASKGTPVVSYFPIAIMPFYWNPKEWNVFSIKPLMGFASTTYICFIHLNTFPKIIIILHNYTINKMFPLYIHIQPTHTKQSHSTIIKLVTWGDERSGWRASTNNRDTKIIIRKRFEWNKIHVSQTPITNQHVRASYSRNGFKKKFCFHFTKFVEYTEVLYFCLNKLNGLFVK